MLRSRRFLRGARGVTYLEAIAAIAILGLAILASAGFMVRRHALVARVDAHVVADQALASEMALVLAGPAQALAVGEREWTSGSERSRLLSPARGLVRVSEPEPGLRLVRVELRHGKGHVVARERLVSAP